MQLLRSTTRNFCWRVASKFVSRSWIAANREDLAVLAPEAEELIRSLFLSLEAVNEMLRDQLDTGGGSGSR